MLFCLACAVTRVDDRVLLTARRVALPPETLVYNHLSGSRHADRRLTGETSLAVPTTPTDMSCPSPLMYLSLSCFVWLWSARSLAAPPANGEEERGVVFNRLKTILLAERYAPVQFVVPFPAYTQNITKRLEEAAVALENLWNLPTYDCDMLHIETFQDNHTSRIIREAFNENDLALQEISDLRTEAGLLLPSRETSLAAPGRERRLAPMVLGAAAVGMLGLGLGAALGSGCFLHGVLGSCPEEKIAANTANVQATMQEMNLQRKHWFQLQDELDDKFYLIGDTVTELYNRQDEIVNHTDEFWRATNTALRALHNNTREMRMCDVYLFTRTQANHVRTTVLAEVDALISSIRSYRAALVAYRINLLSSLSHLSFGRLPLSLVDRGVLSDILMEVATAQLHAPDRLTLAVPLDDILAYYEMTLVEQVYTTESGLFIKFLVPLTSRELVLDVYEAIALPMPGKNDDAYTEWRFDHPFFAISATLKEHAILSLRELEQCRGTRSLAICHQGFPVYRNRESCLASLFFADSAAAMSLCQINTTPYPSSPVARNLGFGRWLLFARSADFTLQLHNKTSETNALSTLPGCRACILTLACGTELSTDALHLRADIASCARVGARNLALRLPAPLAHLFSAIPDSHPFPTIAAVRDAHHSLFTDVQVQVSSLKRSEVRPEVIERIAKPLADQYLSVSQNLKTQVVTPSDYWRASLTVGVTGFLISMAMLSIVGGYLYVYVVRLVASLPPTGSTTTEQQDSGSGSEEPKRAAPATDAPRATRPSYHALRQLLYQAPPSYQASARLPQLLRPNQQPSAPAI